MKPEYFESRMAALAKHRKNIDALEEIYTKFKDLETDLSLGVDANNIYGWINQRDTLQLMMTLAPIWEKEYTNSYIRYSALFNDDVEICLFVEGEALPPTCKLIETEKVEPSYVVPERVTKSYKLQCD